MNLPAEISISELAFCVGETFCAAGKTAVLSGGGAAAVYSPDAYQSHDLDFILEYHGGLSHLLTDLGFSPQHGQYKHPDFSWTLEFPLGPLAIGGDHNIKPHRLVCQITGHRLNILSPTDCVRDRLIHFLSSTHPDFSALEQALAVARAIRNEVDFEFIKKWAIGEEVRGRYELFESRLNV